jgi:hypothetical protein
MARIQVRKEMWPLLDQARNVLLPTVIVLLAQLFALPGLTGDQQAFTVWASLAVPPLAASWILERGPHAGAPRRLALRSAFTVGGCFFGVASVIWFLQSFDGRATQAFVMSSALVTAAVLIMAQFEPEDALDEETSSEPAQP